VERNGKEPEQIDEYLVRLAPSSAREIVCLLPEKPSCAFLHCPVGECMLQTIGAQFAGALAGRNILCVCGESALWRTLSPFSRGIQPPSLLFIFVRVGSSCWRRTSTAPALQRCNQYLARRTPGTRFSAYAVAFFALLPMLFVYSLEVRSVAIKVYVGIDHGLKSKARAKRTVRIR